MILIWVLFVQSNAQEQVEALFRHFGNPCFRKTQMTVCNYSQTKQLGKKKICRKIHLLLATAALVCVDTHTHNMTKPQCMYKQYVDSSHKTHSSKWRWWWWSIAETSGRDTYYKKDTKQNRNGSWNYRNTVRVGPYFKVHFTDELISARVSHFSSV